MATHTDAGAVADLRTVVPRLKLGGVLVFDDLANPGHPGLRRVWEREVVADPRFSTWAFDELGFGVGGRRAEVSVSQLAGASVLITGGAGFVGGHLVASVTAAGGRVTVLDNFRSGHRADLVTGVRVVEADIRRPAEVRRAVAADPPRWVFHLAANASVPGSVMDPAYDL